MVLARLTMAEEVMAKNSPSLLNQQQLVPLSTLQVRLSNSQITLDFNPTTLRQHLVSMVTMRLSFSLKVLFLMCLETLMWMVVDKLGNI